MANTPIPAFYARLGISERVIEQSDKFQILGDFCQVVHLKLEPGQTVQVEPGAMVYMSDNCEETVKLAGIGRMLMDGSLVKGCYKNKDLQTAGYLGLTHRIPSNIIPINLDSMGGSIKGSRLKLYSECLCNSLSAYS